MRAQGILVFTRLLPHIPLAGGCVAATTEVGGCCFECGAMHMMHSTESWLKPMRLWGNTSGVVSRTAPFYLKGLWVMSLYGFGLFVRRALSHSSKAGRVVRVGQRV